MKDLPNFTCLQDCNTLSKISFENLLFFPFFWLGTLIEFKCVKFEGDRLVKWENFNIDMNRKYKT